MTIGPILALPLITLAAAVVNGGLGYGFSSITVPVALLFYANRVLNPAMVLVEVAMNAYTLVVNRRSLPAVWRRVLPIMLGLLPGVALGSWALFLVKPEWLKVATYAVLTPLILLQAAGFRRPLRSERSVGLPFGAGIGFLYSVTTISGPPLALLLNNQGYVKEEFRAALGLIRLAESLATAVSYAFLGLYSAQCVRLLGSIAPSVAVGIPLGVVAIRRMDPETFRRVCMSFDAWIVGFGLSKVLIAMGWASAPAAYAPLAAVAAIDAALLWRFFSVRRAGAAALLSVGAID